MNSQLEKISSDDSQLSLKLELDGNTYYTVRSVSKEREKKIYWVWGKTNFLSVFIKENDIWRCQKVLLIKTGKFYEFIEVTGHGAMFEETRWTSSQDELYIELPVHFSHYMLDISIHFLNELDSG